MACAGLSCALFAPGWVWEDANPRTTWQQRSARFWELLEGSIRASRAPRAITRLPFSSSFSQGCGEATFHKVTSQSPRYGWTPDRRFVMLKGLALSLKSALS